MKNYTEQEKYWIWMASLNLDAKTFYYILKEFWCAEGFFDAAKNDACVDKIPAEAQRAAKAACSRQRIAEILSELSAKGISAVSRLSGDYPKALSGIPYPPPVLFVKGDIGGVFNSEKRLDCVSIVGTRRCTRKGAEVARKLARELAEKGIAVVSGMARGIDTAAHAGALEGGGKTIAVLRCGTDVIYPPESADIYYSIAENGAVISELAPGTQPLAANFPVRNRIIAGLSPATLIVESEKEGGTAITAYMAVSFGRDVFAVPGAPYVSTAQLSNMLIAQGAHAVQSAADILSFYGISGEERRGGGGIEHIQLDFLQRQIYNLLLQGDTSVESMTSCIKYPQSEINCALTIMELGGLIKRLPGVKYGI